MNTKFQVAATVALFAAATFGSTYYASPTGAADAACTEDDPGTIQAAVNLSANRASWEEGDEIILLPGTYDYSDPSWSGKNCVDVPKNKHYITIRSTSGNPADAILLGRGGETYISTDLLTTNEPFNARAVYTASRLRLQGITITNFYNTANGVAGYSGTAGYLLFEDCIIVGNSGASALYQSPATRTRFLNNTSSGAGGAVNTGTQYVECLFVGNTSGGSGGALYKGKCIDCTFIGNRAAGGGGAIDTSYDLIRCVFTNNTAAGNGGAVTFGNGATYVATNCVFIQNTADTSGGALRSHANKVYDSVFIENYAPRGGASFYGGFFYNCRFQNNSANQGGALYNGTPRNCRFVENHTTGSGGATCNANDYNCIFERNTCSSGTVAGNNFTVNDCEFYFNKATEYTVANGPILHNCLVVSNETTSGNSRTCGLIYNFPPINCTFIGNNATGTSVSGVLTVPGQNCLLNGNLPRDIGNISVTYNSCLYGTASSSPTYLNCIVTNNPHFNFGHNPKLAWYAPRKRSPARDAGLEQSWAADSLDLAGNPRLNGPIDIGCYEFWPSTDSTKVMLR